MRRDAVRRRIRAPRARPESQKEKIAPMNAALDRMMDFDLTEEIKTEAMQGDLKKTVGALSRLVSLRVHFYTKKIKMGDIDYIEAYVSMETKNLMCKWAIALDGRVRVRVSI